MRKIGVLSTLCAEFVLSLLVLLIVTPVWAAPFDLGLSPNAKYSKQIYMHGAFSLDDGNCSSVAASKHLQGMKLLRYDQSAKNIVEIVARLRAALFDTSDGVVIGRHVCVGMYDDQSSAVGNALSHPEGYILFDHKFIQHIFGLRNVSSEAMDFVVAHEFAHQLQHWNQDRYMKEYFEKKRSARVMELRADCLASALLTKDLIRRYPKNDPWFLNNALSGIRSAAAQMGDFDVKDRGHHGMPGERRRAVDAGIALARMNLTSAIILNSCMLAIERTVAEQVEPTR